MPYIDVTNILATISNNTLYTATEDCILFGYFGRAAYQNVSIEIDGVSVVANADNSASTQIKDVFQMALKSGHTFKIIVSSGTVGIKAYGLL